MAARKISHPKKSDQQPNQEAVALPGDTTRLKNSQWNSSRVLKSPACPQQLDDAIVDCLKIQSRNDCYNVDFLMGLFLSKPRQAKEAEGGAR